MEKFTNVTKVKNEGKVNVLLLVPVETWAEVKAMGTIRRRSARDLAVEILD